MTPKAESGHLPKETRERLKALEGLVRKARDRMQALAEENETLRTRVDALEAERKDLAARTKQLQEESKRTRMARGRNNLARSKIQDIIRRIERVESEGKHARSKD